jgi:PAS domain S-box-containing protein
MLGTAQDITERVQVERDLRRSGESYRMLAENVKEMILRFTPAGRITYASPSTHAILGYQPAEVIGREGSEFLHPDDLALVVEAHAHMLHGTEPPAVLSRLLHRDGHPVWTETTTRAVRDPETGEIEAIVAVSRDVTESVRTARLSRLVHVVAMAANEAESAREALQAALALVCEHTGWTIGHAYVPGGNAGVEPGTLDIWHVDDPGRHALLREFISSTVLPAGEGLLGRVLKRGEAECIPNIAVDPFFRRSEMANRLGVRSAFAFPVWAGDETIAVLEFFGEEPQEPDSVVIDLLSNVVGQLGEILRRKQAEQALRASEERFRALAESANDAFVTVDGKGDVVYCNQSLQRIFGYSCDEVCGKPIDQLLAKRHPDSRPFDLGTLLATGDHLVGRRIELTGRRKDGTLLPLEMSLAGWQTDEGSFVTGILRDISDRKQAELALAEKMGELARSNAELGLFTYVASHDLREPLRTVGGNVQLLARALAGRPDDDTHRQLEFAIGGVRRMQALIDDLLAYSRVGTEGKVFVELDSAEALHEAIQALSVAIEESAGTVTVGPLPRIIGDRSQLVQLFQNLLSNAIKFHGSEPPRVDVEAEREGNAWVFSVLDRGIGIEPQYADHVFTIFQRLHTREEYPGSGIGLAVCRKIVERHGGRIWVDSEPGQGSAFRFTIPTRGLRLA